MLPGQTTHPLSVRLRARLGAVSAYDAATVVLLLALVVLVFLTYDPYAISNDEDVQQRYGELILAYYASGFADRRCFTSTISTSTAACSTSSPSCSKCCPATSLRDPASAVALIGVGGIGAAWATARLIAGPRAGAHRRARARGVRAVVRRDVQSHQGHALRRRDDRRGLFPAARDARPAAPALGDVRPSACCLGAALGIRVLGLLLVGYVAFAHC